MLGRHKKAVFGIGLGLMLIALNFSIVSLALATIQKGFDVSYLYIQWMLNIYGIFISSCLVTVGRLADTYGRKKVYLVGLIGAGVASLIAGSAITAMWIIFAQMLQGIFGAILLSVSQALMVHEFPEEKKGQAIGIWASIAGISLGLGPLLGGLIVHFIGWRFIFYINIPIALAALYLSLRYVRESKDKNHAGEMDYLGMILLFLTVGFLVLGVQQGGNWGYTSIWSFLCFGGGILFGFSLLVVEKRVSHPILRAEFFLKKGFLIPSIVNGCLIFFLWSMFYLFPLYMQDVWKMSPLSAGMMMLFVTGPVALFAAAVGRMYDRIGVKPLILVGLIFLLASILLQMFLHKRVDVVIGTLAALTFGVGWVLVWGPSTTAAISSLPKDKAGVASGAFTTVQEVSATIGLAITGTVFRMGNPPFMTGYQNSLWILFAMICFGLFVSLGLGSKKKENQSPVS